MHRVTERTPKLAQGIAIRNGHIPDFAINRKLLKVVGRAAFLPNGCALPLVTQALCNPPGPFPLRDGRLFVVAGLGRLWIGAAGPGEVALAQAVGEGQAGW